MTDRREVDVVVCGCAWLGELRFNHPVTFANKCLDALVAGLQRLGHVARGAGGSHV